MRTYIKIMLTLAACQAHGGNVQSLKLPEGSIMPVTAKTVTTNVSNAKKLDLAPPTRLDSSLQPEATKAQPKIYRTININKKVFRKKNYLQKRLGKIDMYLEKFTYNSGDHDGTKRLSIRTEGDSGKLSHVNIVSLDGKKVLISIQDEQGRYLDLKKNKKLVKVFRKVAANNTKSKKAGKSI